MRGPPGIFPPARRGEVDSEQIQEIVEKIIEEKWDSVAENFNKIIDWKETVEVEINGLKSKINGLNENISSVQRAMNAKVEDYDKTMRDVGTDVKALTMVFQKILPGFMENVQELSKITDRFKGGSAAKIMVKPKKSKGEEIFEEKSIEDIE